MKIYIEILVLLALVAVFLVGTALKLITGWISKRRYKEENDRSKLGEDKRRADIDAAAKALGDRRLAESSQRSDLPAAVISPPRENSDSGRKASNRIRAFFQRRTR